KKESAATSETATAAKAALKEVELYFDSDRAQLSYLAFTDSVSRQAPGWSYEEMLAHLEDKDSRAREAAVNVIAQVAGSNKSKGIVAELIETLKVETNLRVIARISRALSIITNEEFEPWDRDGILSWWRIHDRDPRYQSPFGGFRQALRLLNKENTAEDLPKAVTLLDETLKADPDAIYTRALKIRCLIARDDLSDAEKEVSELERRQGDFRWGLLWKSLLLHRQGKNDAAVTTINAAFDRSPELVKSARDDEAFKDLLENPKIVWPQKSKS
ncbi:MAG: tetratricopeptide repeat protein, partial [Chthoniobacterales bacterium]